MGPADLYELNIVMHILFVCVLVTPLFQSGVVQDELLQTRSKCSMSLGSITVPARETFISSKLPSKRELLERMIWFLVLRPNISSRGKICFWGLLYLVRWNRRDARTPMFPTIPPSPPNPISLGLFSPTRPSGPSWSSSCDVYVLSFVPFP